MKGFSRTDVLHLTSVNAGAYLTGGVSWQAINGGSRGDAMIECSGFQPGETKMILNLTVPNQPTFVLSIRGRHCWRLDVNVPHRDLPGTHMQETDETGREVRALDAVGIFPPIPRSGPVDGAQYRATFLAFAAHLNIEGSTLDWVDPPQRSAP